MRNLPDKRNHHQESGMTLLDLLVVISGVVPALLIVGVGPEPWRRLFLCVLGLIFGISFWCILFLWLLPFLERRSRNHP
jgi:hypothetical protein